MFPGQGSQRKGMGKGLFEKYPDIVSQADTILGYSIEDLCVHDPEGKLNNTEYTQPAIFTVSCLHYHDRINNTNEFTHFLGHSVGEYAALYAAGVVSFSDCLEIVRKRAKLMSSVKGCVLIAVVGIESSEIEKFLSLVPISDIFIANINSPDQVVVGCGYASYKVLINYWKVKELPGRLIKLNVSGAFHTPYLYEASQLFKPVLAKQTFNTSPQSVISNLTCKPHKVDELEDILSKHISTTVNWLGSIEYCLDSGVIEFEEIGANILTPMVERIKKQRETDATPSKTASNKISTKDLVSNLQYDSNHILKHNEILNSGFYHDLASLKRVEELAENSILSLLSTSGSAELLVAQIDYLYSKGLKDKFGISISPCEEEMNTYCDVIWGKEITYLELFSNSIFTACLREKEKSEKIIIYWPSSLMQLEDALSLTDVSSNGLVDIVVLDQSYFEDDSNITNIYEELKSRTIHRAQDLMCAFTTDYVGDTEPDIYVDKFHSEKKLNSMNAVSFPYLFHLLQFPTH